MSNPNAHQDFEYEKLLRSDKHLDRKLSGVPSTRLLGASSS